MIYIIGKYYKVLCFIEKKLVEKCSELEWIVKSNGEVVHENVNRSYFFEYVYPLINHPHNDIENGQKEIHYHIDDRFKIEEPYRAEYPLQLRIFIKKTEKHQLQYRMVKCVKSEIRTKTSELLIKDSKLKHKCIYKGKCPHRGYDLSNEIPINGVITCPLHSLRFDSETKLLIQ